MKEVMAEKAEVLNSRSVSPLPMVDNISEVGDDDGLMTSGNVKDEGCLCLKSLLTPSVSPSPKSKIPIIQTKQSDACTLTPSHWTSVAAETEINDLKKQAYSLHDQLQRCYEIEEQTNNYITVLKSRSRSVQHAFERVQIVEAENRRLKRDLEYEFDDAMTQKRRIDFLEKKLDIIAGEKENLVMECADLRRQRENTEKDMIDRERVISGAYRKKLEEEVKKVEHYYKNQMKNNELCSNCLTFIAVQAERVAATQETSMNTNINNQCATSMDSRVILVNPSHPSFERIRGSSIEELRHTTSNVNTHKIDERVELTYYAEPLNPPKPGSSKPRFTRPSTSLARDKKPKRMQKSKQGRCNESLNKYRKVEVKRLRESH